MMLPLLLLLALLAQPQPAPQTPAAPPDAPAGQVGGTEATPLSRADSVDTLLKALHQRGLNLRGFSADVDLKENDLNTGDQNTKSGRVLYDAGNSSIRVDFATSKDEGKPARPYKQIYLLREGTLTDRNYRSRSEAIRQVLRPGEKLNLLKLGEGPFPLPIGQEPAEVERQFTVTKLTSDDARPALHLVPKEGTRLADKFKHIDVWIDPATHFPTLIQTLDAAGIKEKGTDLKNIQVNPAIKPQDFTLEPLPDNAAAPEGERWNRTEKRFEDR